jgi:hypothetical protein
MSVTQLIHCDRCGRTILEGRTLLRIETWTSRHQEAIDMCPGCADAWRAWLHQPEADAFLNRQPPDLQPKEPLPC